MNLSAPKKPARYWLALCALVGGAICAGESLRFVSHSYQIGVDTQDEPCMPGRINLVRVDAAVPPHRGELVAFRTDRAAPYLTTKNLMGKQVVGLPGDRYRVAKQEFYVNEVPYGRLNLCDKRYVPQYCDDRTGVVPAGDMLVWTSHPNSFDSRYWGALPQQAIVGRIIWPVEGRLS